MEQIFKYLHDYPYIAYSLAVVLFTAGVRYTFFEGIKLGPKWITFGVGVVLAIMLFVMKWIDLQTPMEFYLLFASLGASSAFYDYLIKVIVDIANRKNPFKE